jgi:hypothetical protein
MRMRHLIALIGLTLLTTPLPAQERKVTIVQIWENFLASSVAHNKCGTKDEALEKKFAMNLFEVTIRATQKVKEEKPENPEAELVKLMDNKGKEIRAKVEEIAASKGCDFDGIQRLLKLYKFHAEWDMHKSAGR